MTTKRELLAQAMEEFGVSDATFDISPEETQKGLTRLNRIAAQWDGQGIRVGFNLGGGLDDEAGIPDTAENAFALNLAVQWAGAFGKTVTQDLRIAARAAWNALYTARQVHPEVPYSSRLPLGSGNRLAGRQQQYFPDTDDIAGLSDGATEF